MRQARQESGIEVARGSGACACLCCSFEETKAPRGKLTQAISAHIDTVWFPSYSSLAFTLCSPKLKTYLIRVHLLLRNKIVG